MDMDLILLFDGFTLYYKGAYTTAYLYGWMMIETFIGIELQDIIQISHICCTANAL
jgi:hypothetical protein